MKEKLIEIVIIGNKGQIEYSNNLRFTEERYKRLTLLSDVIEVSNNYELIKFVHKKNKMTNIILWRGFIRPWIAEDNAYNINHKNREKQ